jgi:hypothetical protein
MDNYLPFFVEEYSRLLDFRRWIPKPEYKNFKLKLHWTATPLCNET